MNDEAQIIEKISALHEEFIRYQRLSCRKSIELGEILLAEKEKHKNCWGEWIKENLPFSHSKANEHMSRAMLWNSSSFPGITNEDELTIPQLDMLLSATKEVEREAQRERIIQKLRDGVLVKQIQREEKCGSRLIRECYDEVLRPEYLAVDWESECTGKYPEFKVLKYKEAIREQAKESGGFKSWFYFAASRLPTISRSRLQKAHECNGVSSEVIKHYEEGRISVYEAKRISLLPSNEQRLECRKLDNKAPADSFDSAKRMIVTMSDLVSAHQSFVSENGCIVDASRVDEAEEMLVKCDRICEWLMDEFSPQLREVIMKKEGENVHA